MTSNSFGNHFRITTWGESHGKAIGVVIDGCPAGHALSIEEINRELARRAPGKSPYTSPRKEPDQVEVYSGLFEGKTTGAPLSLIIPNQDADSSKYEPIKDLLRPGHANATYLQKYGIFDYRGGGRSSARETACRVAAGAVAKQLLKKQEIEIHAYIKEIGGIMAESPDPEHLPRQDSPLFCCDPVARDKIIAALEAAIEEKDSLGGVIECVCHVPPGLGDPLFEKLEANLAKAMMSLPATKGFEIGSGFAAARMKGSEHNDTFYEDNGKIKTKTNHAGGVLGGISTGMPLIFRVAFKPTSSIGKPQQTLTTQGAEVNFTLPEGSRHDPCVALRAVPTIEAMAAIVLINHLTI